MSNYPEGTKICTDGELHTYDETLHCKKCHRDVDDIWENK